MDTVFKNKIPVMFPGHKVSQLNLSHIPRPEGSTIKPQSCCQATGFQNETVLMFPGHTVPESTGVMFPGHRVPESILIYVPRLQGSRINLSHIPRPQFCRITPQSCSQTTGIQNQTSVMLPGHRVPPSILIPISRPQCSTIKPQSCSQA